MLSVAWILFGIIPGFLWWGASMKMPEPARFEQSKLAARHTDAKEKIASREYAGY